MSKPQYIIPPGSNNGTQPLSGEATSSVEPEKIDLEIDKDAIPRPGSRISPGLPYMDMKDISLRELLERGLKGDQNAWDEFGRRTLPTIRGAVANRLHLYSVKSTDIVGDVANNAYEKLCRHNYRVLRKDWEDDLCIFKYIKVVAHNAVVDWLRTNKMSKHIEGLDDHQELPAPLASSPTLIEILRRDVDRCLLAFESDPNFKRDRTIFWLYFRYQYHDSEIATLTKLPVRKVQNILQRYVRVVRLKLRKDKGKSAPGE